MNENDVMKSLARSRPASLEPAPDPARLDRIIATAEARPGPAVRAPRRRARAARVGYAGALAVAAAALAVTVGGGPEPTADPAARRLLLAAADSSLRAPATTGRYWHTRGVNSGGGQLPAGQDVQGPCHDETWVARSPREPSWWIINTWSKVTVRPGAPSPERGKAWSSGDGGFACTRGNRSVAEDKGRTPTAVKLGDFAEPGSSWPNVNGRAVSIAEIQALPTEPDALKDLLLRWQGSTPANDETANEVLFFQAAELLLELPTPPDVRAGLFRMLAGLPGVGSAGEVRDPLGRTGMGVALRTCLPSYGQETRIMFDEPTGRLLAVTAATGTSCANLDRRHWSAVLESGWTDASPVLPAARH
ncbi:hypothetical protein Sru01_03390 [Sphaerisporangium rufum]|uniref:Uncharacterized protein n=1 Tax=Sphaerisporangium rufum TaxID=1381558 RepID=A0A919UYQ2_9ACTN|nr:CU044_5270 family protein [Sphaerisporangium rufum]GII75357.1 hypothetical protein Sru01_03390 [Sphaerisporangium rufum]